MTVVEAWQHVKLTVINILIGLVCELKRFLD